MTDGGAAFLPGAGVASAPFRPRSAYVGHEAFGDGDGAVLLEPQVALDLRLAAESATKEGRIAGGLLYGRGWTDSRGAYLVINGFLAAGNEESRDDPVSADGHDEFTLSEADLRLLRRDAARMYAASVEAGWWRSLPAAGKFGFRDFETQAELVPPGGAGLLVFGSGVDWGTAYLGPDALPPGAAGLVHPTSWLAPESSADLGPATGLRPEPDLGPYADLDLEAPADFEPPADFEQPLDFEPPPDLEPAAGTAGEPWPDLDAEPYLDDQPGPEALAPAVPATALVTRRQPALTPAPQPTGPRAVSPVRKPEQEWGVKPAGMSHGPEMPTDAKIVVGLFVAVIIAAAIMVGMLVSNVIVAVVVGVVGVLVICLFLWFARL